MNQRSDARRNRDALLRAAEEVFATESVDVPLQQIAARAGVGRGTLYRHFPDRYALVAAIYERRLASYEDYARNHASEPDVLLTLLRSITSEQGRIPGLFRLIFAVGPGRDYLDPLWQRSIAMLSEPLRVSQAAAVVRADLTVDDILIVVGMIYGVVNSPAGQRGDAVNRAFDLAIAGLAPR